MTTSIQQAVLYLKKGNILVYPTDTLYALGADVFNETAVRSIFTLKYRPLTIPLPIAVGSIQQMETVSILTRPVKKIVTHFLPGPLTIVVKKKPILSDLLTSGKHTIAIRIPNDPLALKLLKSFGPLTVTSANIHMKNTPASINEIKTLFPSSPITMFLDDGQRNGQPSTIVDCTSDRPKILRDGTISIHDILSVV